MGSATSRRNPGSTTDGQELAELEELESIRIDRKHEPERPEPAEDPNSILVSGSEASASAPLLDPGKQR